MAEAALSAESGAAIPYAGRTVIALAPEHFAAIRRTVALLFGLAHSPAWAFEVDGGAGEVERREPGNTGVFMGYDFHLTAAGPRLIEVNTNAGGALLNGLHTASLCDPARLACLCADLLPVEAIQDRIARMFAAELRAARGPGAELRSVAIADENPRGQFLYPEFELCAELLRGAGVAVEIRDTAELDPRAFDPSTCATPRARRARSAALRAAYLTGDAVLTPSPREHHLLANKRSCSILVARRAGALACPRRTRSFAETVPRRSCWRARRRRAWDDGATGFSSRAQRSAAVRCQRRSRASWTDPRRSELRGAAQSRAVAAGGRDPRGPARDEVRRPRVRVPRRGGPAGRARTRSGHQPAQPGGRFSAICVAREQNAC